MQHMSVQSGMNHAYYRANNNRWTILFEEGEAILSHYPLKNLSTTELKPRDGFFEHRVVLHTVTETPKGESEAASRIYLDTFPEAEFVVIEDAAHFPFYERPDDFARTISQFLDDIK